MRRKVLTLIVVTLIFTLSSIGDAYDNKTTHRRITEKTIPESNLKNYLQHNLGITKGYKEKIKGKQIIEWFSDGSDYEDVPDCRASNHFHNPLLLWNQSYMTDQPDWLDVACLDWKPWYSNVTWATGYLSPSPNGSKTSFSTLYKTYNWDNAREDYYRALTTTSAYDRDGAFVSSFETVGHILHLLQDVSVPAHVRNDFTSHLIFNGIEFSNPKKWYIQPFENYVKNNSTLVAIATPALPTFAYPRRLTDFWDTDQYNGGNPSTSLSIGLAEFTNANYFSDSTIPSNNPTVEHRFTHPQVNFVNNYICEDYLPGSNKPTKYISRKPCPPEGTGEVDHLAAISFMNRADNVTNSNIQNLKVWLDDNVHNTYAKELLPRAVGYSAGLLDYFFRGNIEVTLPDSGIYAQTNNPAGFTRIKLLAKNTTPNTPPNSEEMNDNNGSIELVVKYRLAYDDPFINYPPDYNFRASDEFFYRVVPELNGTHSIPRDAPVELTFDLTSNPIPLWAIDVYLFVVYKGKLGNEEGAVAVGLKDISEPTPVDFWNDTDRICINGAFYTAGSPEAIAQVDAPENGGNNNGVADEWDVYAHDINNIYTRISPIAHPGYASPYAPDNSFVVLSLPAGAGINGAFILTDYDFNEHHYSTWAGRAGDPWQHSSVSGELWPNIAIKNQTDYVEDPPTCAPLSAPCNIWWYPTFLEYRDYYIWWGGGLMYINNAYPPGSECTCYEGILRTCPAEGASPSKTEITSPESAIMQDGTIRMQSPVGSEGGIGGTMLPLSP